MITNCWLCIIVIHRSGTNITNQYKIANVISLLVFLWERWFRYVNRNIDITKLQQFYVIVHFSPQQTRVIPICSRQFLKLRLNIYHHLALWHLQTQWWLSAGPPLLVLLFKDQPIASACNISLRHSFNLASIIAKCMRQQGLLQLRAAVCCVYGWFYACVCNIP